MFTSPRFRSRRTPKTFLIIIHKGDRARCLSTSPNGLQCALQFASKFPRKELPSDTIGLDAFGCLPVKSALTNRSRFMLKQLRQRFRQLRLRRARVLDASGCPVERIGD